MIPQPILQPMIPLMSLLGSIFPLWHCPAQLQVALWLPCGFTISSLKLEDSHSINGPRLPQNNGSSLHPSMKPGMKPLLTLMTETTPSSLIADPEFVLRHPEGRLTINSSWLYLCLLTMLQLVTISSCNLSTYPNNNFDNTEAFKDNSTLASSPLAISMQSSPE